MEQAPLLPDKEQHFLETYFPTTYQELKRLALSQLRGERENHTFCATDLVHEVYLNLASQDKQAFESKGHFFHVACLAMRRILISYARKKQSQKRGGDQILITLEADQVSHVTRFDDLLGLDEALDDFQRIQPRAASIIECWFFGGFKQEEIAEILGISEATVRREWRFARAWLSSRLNDTNSLAP